MTTETVARSYPIQEAAALTGLTRHTIRDSAWHGDRPDEVLTSLNRAILRAQTDSFCTAIYGAITVVSGQVQMSFACGGHPLPVRVTSIGSHAIGRPGALLGVFPERSEAVHTVPLDAGDFVVLYTDGATDLPPPNALTAGEFTELVDRCRDARTADELADRIRDELESVLPFTARNDDIALLILRASGLGLTGEQ